MTIRDSKRIYRESHREQINARQREYDAAHREEIRARKNAFYHSHKESYRVRYEAWRGRRLELYYGITLADYDRILAGQNGQCAICHTSNWRGKAPHVDHDHATGEVRGILCGKCNTAIALISDDPATSESMTKYLLGNKRAIRDLLTHADALLGGE